MEPSYEEIDDGIKEYFKSLKHFKALDKAEEHKLLESYKKHNDLKARNKLIESNLKFACKIANSYRGRGLAFWDLISEANNGLIEAIDTFDMDYDVKLFSYSKWKIIQHIQKAISDNNKIQTDDFNEYEGYDNDDGIMMCSDNYISDNTVQNTYDITELLNNVMFKLSERERDIICLNYGINVPKRLTLEEIGDKYGLTKERVRQIIEKAMTKVRSEAMLVDSVYLD